MAETFYPFVENGDAASEPSLVVRHPARIAVFDDLSAAPRVVIVDPSDVRSYLEEITNTVTKLAQEQGGKIPFMVVREVVENLIHAYFIEPAISILDHGNTIRFSDQGPGIADKVRALEYGTTSATVEMKRYIRGVGSGLPYVQQWLQDKGGTLTVEDNIHNGTVVTVSLAPEQESAAQEHQAQELPVQAYQQTGQGEWPAWPQNNPYGAAQTVEGYPGYPQNYPVQQGFSQQGYTPQPAWPQQAAQAWQGYPPQQGAYPLAYPQTGYPAQGWQQPGMQGWQQSPMAQQTAMQVFQQPQAMQQRGMTQPPPAPQPLPTVTERGAFALEYLRTHEFVGPRDLNALNQLSESTWSRALMQLKDQGLIDKKGGQKYHLTPLGKQMLGLA